MKFLGITTLVIFYEILELCTCVRIKMTRNTHHDLVRNMTEEDGYPLEAHKLITRDGYILTTYRIPYGKNTSSVRNNIPILFTHGMGGTCENFLIHGPEKGIAYYFANKGYDVWLLNSRGTRHSTKHLIYNTTQKEYWNFSFHEIGVEDITTNIDYILKVTNHEKVIFVGYSMGTTVYFITVTARPEYNEKILVAIEFGPSVLRAHLKDTFRPFYSLAKNYKVLEEVFADANAYEFLPNVEWVRTLLKTVCGVEILKGFCNIAMDMVGGSHSSNTDRAYIDKVLTYIPAGTAVKQLLHYMQHMASGNFSQYDYGPEENMKIYNSTYPPMYNLSLATAPVILVYCTQDWFSENEIEPLKKVLPNIYWAYEVPVPDFNHVDLILADKVIPLVFDPVYEKIKYLK